MSAEAERDFYRALVELGEEVDPARFLPRALELAVGAVGARIGYLAIGVDPLGDPRWHHTVGVEDLAGLRDVVSSTILARGTRELIVTTQATEDERFREAASVRRHKIDQVICTPFPSGVLYLQGRRRPAPFGDDDLRLVRAFVRHLGPLADRLRWQARWSDDPTRPIREEMTIRGVAGRSAALARVLRQVKSRRPRTTSWCC